MALHQVTCSGQGALCRRSTGTVPEAHLVQPIAAIRDFLPLTLSSTGGLATAHWPRLFLHFLSIQLLFLPAR